MRNIESQPKSSLRAPDGGKSPVLGWLRTFNRKYFNPFSLSFSGRPNSFWSIIRHVGRRSGKEYTTPVVAVHSNGSFIIPLPYGRHVDWSRNTLAAGECTLIHNGKVYQASQPELIPSEEGVAAFPSWVQSLLHRSNTDCYLRLNKVEEHPDAEWIYRWLTATYPIERGVAVLAGIGLAAAGTALLVNRLRK